MRRTTGTQAITAAYGEGFRPSRSLASEYADHPGRRVVRMEHPDGRQLLFSLTPEEPEGYAPQYGDLIEVYATGLPDAWRVSFQEGRRTAATPAELRAWLAEHDPARERPYSGEQPIPQPRELDGRERDILTRIIDDLRRAWSDPAKREPLLRVVSLDDDEVLRLTEIGAVLDPRDD